MSVGKCGSSKIGMSGGSLVGWTTGGTCVGKIGDALMGRDRCCGGSRSGGRVRRSVVPCVGSSVGRMINAGCAAGTVDTAGKVRRSEEAG